MPRRHEVDDDDGGAAPPVSHRSSRNSSPPAPPSPSMNHHRHTASPNVAYAAGAGAAPPPAAAAAAAPSPSFDKSNERVTPRRSRQERISAKEQEQKTELEVAPDIAPDEPSNQRPGAVRKKGAPAGKNDKHISNNKSSSYDSDDSVDSHCFPGANRIGGHDDEPNRTTIAAANSAGAPPVVESSMGRNPNATTATATSAPSVQESGGTVLEAHLAPNEDEVADRILRRVLDTGHVIKASVVPDEDGTAAATATTSDEEPFCCGLSFRAVLIILAVSGCLLAAVAILVGVLVATGEGEEKIPTAAPSLPPTVEVVITPAPQTMTPTMTPTTLAPTVRMFSPRFEQLYGLIGASIAEADPLNLRNTDTPQHWALTWMADEDAATNFDITPINVLIDRFVMVLFYNVTGGDSWEEDFNFLTPPPVCRWNTLIGTDRQGVHCTGNDIVEIEIYDNGLGGTLPTEIGLLTSLEELRINDNRIFGTLPTEIGNLRNLNTLYCSRNIFDGTVPTELGRLLNLRRLWLNDNAFIGNIPSELGNMQNLDLFDLGDNSLEGSIPPEIFGMAALVQFRVSHNSLTGSLVPSQLARLSNLSDLFNVRNNRMEGPIPTEIGLLTAIGRLVLDNNAWTGTIPTEFGRLRQMRAMYVHTSGLSGQIPTELGELTRLTRMNFYDMPLLTGTIPTEFQALTLLEEFRAQRTALTGGFEEVFCNNITVFTDLDALLADCHFANLEVSCSCCTLCCRDDTGLCHDPDSF